MRDPRANSKPANSAAIHYSKGEKPLICRQLWKGNALDFDVNLPTDVTHSFLMHLQAVESPVVVRVEF